MHRRDWVGARRRIARTDWSETVGDKTGIEWTDATWNPTTGCDKVSPGCDNCYALTMAGRLKGMGSAKYQRDGDPRTSGPGFGLTVHPDTLDQPLRWKRPRRIFVNSMSDLFHPDVPNDFIVKVFDTMANAYQHTFQVLTKRPQRMAAFTLAYYSGAFITDWDRGPLAKGPHRNVWLGTSIESDRYAWRANHLRATPAAVRFLSCEPLLAPLPSLDLTGIDWCIVGGESGRGARPMEPRWVRDLRDRSVAAGVAFHFKQWGNFAPIKDEGDGFILKNVGKHAAGRELDGRTWDEWPSNPTPKSPMAVLASDEQEGRSDA